jgi:glycosyltransferase involved in cell wall biosynthesis
VATALTINEPPLAALSGRLRPWHGASTVAEAWRRLGRDAPPLLVIGDGDGREELEAAGATVTGFVPHDAVPGLLSQANIGLVPYAADAPDYFSPIKLFEYLAAGLAVIAADIPGVRDVTGTAAALLVDAGDADGLAAAVARLASDGALRSELGLNGQALVAEAHTWQHRARRVLDIAQAVSAVERALAP